MKDANNQSPFSIEIEFTKRGPKDLVKVDWAVRDSAQYLRAQGFELYRRQLWN